MLSSRATTALTAHLVVAVATIGLSVAHAKSPPKPARYQSAVDRWLKRSTLEGLAVGVAVVDADTGETLALHHPDALMNPASGTKMLSTAAALALLGPETRFETTLHGRLDKATGEIAGDLVFRGGGDPKLLPEHLTAAAKALFTAGVKRVRGDLVVDGTLFAEQLPPAFDQKGTDAGYRASIGGAAVNFGAVSVRVRAGKVGGPVRVSVVPQSDAVVVHNKARSVKGKRRTLKVSARAAKDGRTIIVVSGELGTRAKRYAERKRVANPDLLTAHLFARALDKAGVTLDGKVQLASAPEPGPILHRIEGQTLEAAAADTNTWSNNFMAETLLLHLGKDASKQATFERAVSHATKALVELGMPPDGFRLVNGSGLYDATKVSARAMTTLLTRLRAHPTLARPFAEGLAVAGRSGTLSARLKGKATRGRVIGKTGTLDEVVSLSGYAPGRGGRTLAFSVLINDARPGLTGALRRAIDKLVTDLVGI